MTPATTRTGSFSIGFRRGWGDWQKDTVQLATWAAQNRFAAIDLSQTAPDEAQVLKDAGLVTGTADLLDWGQLMSADTGKRQAAVEKNKAHIRKCAAAGISRFFICLVPEDATRARRDNFADLVSSMAELAPMLEQAQAAICVEGWPGPGALCCTPEGYRALFKEVPSSGMAVNYDPSHLIRMHIDPIRFLHEFAPRVKHIHGKDTELFDEAYYEFGSEQPATFFQPAMFAGATWRYTIPGHGQCRWVESFRILKDAGFEGLVCIELEDDHFNGSEETEKQGLIFARQFLESF